MDINKENKMKINLTELHPNPYRDFNLDPINDVSVAKLADAIGSFEDEDALGFWGGIAVRKQGEGYQLAFGHHRIEALKLAGWDKAELSVVKYDDDQMIRAMAIENATQRGGDGGAINDAVAGVIRRLGYLLLTKTDKELGERLNLAGATIFDKDQIAKTKNTFLKGEGIGHELIKKYEPSLERNAIKNALKSLNEGNYMTVIVESIQLVIEKELEEARIKEDELKQEKRKAEAKAKADELQKQAAQAKKVAHDAIVKQHYDPVCDTIFDRDSHSSAFRDVMTSQNGKEFLVLSEQQNLARTILSDFEIQKGKDGIPNYITAKYIRGKVVAVLAEAMALDGKNAKDLLEKNATEAANFVWGKITKSIMKLPELIDELEVQLSKGGVVEDPELIAEFFSTDLKLSIDKMTDLSSSINIADNIISKQ